MTPSRVLWLIWSLLTISAAGYFFLAISTDQATARRSLLPGETTHGHYQIELACNACHTEFMGVKQDACTACHGEDLKREKDTHPASKFSDPTNAERLAKLDARKCVTCHREHVPDRTLAMGLSLPADYCFHCHEEVAQQRPSHVGMSHDACATAGCHNYHDNRALYEKFLYEHRDEPPTLEDPTVTVREFIASKSQTTVAQHPLRRADIDAPTDLRLPPITEDWLASTHAVAGVNCRGCHEVTSQDGKVREWQNKVSHQACKSCHGAEVESFLAGRHGMRLAQEMTPMRPAMARLKMQPEAAHRQLDCSACHAPHRYDTEFAAVDACMACHDDQHTQSYLASQHYQLWKEERSGAGIAGSGVSCATCHMPRVDEDGKVHVQHNQNSNLRPNEKMIRSVCMSCHGLEFSLNALADSLLIDRCFTRAPSVHVDSVQMAKRWFEQQAQRQQKRK